MPTTTEATQAPSTAENTQTLLLCGDCCNALNTSGTPYRHDRATAFNANRARYSNIRPASGAPGPGMSNDFVDSLSRSAEDPCQLCEGPGSFSGRWRVNAEILAPASYDIEVCGPCARALGGGVHPSDVTDDYRDGLRRYESITWDVGPYGQAFASHNYVDSPSGRPCDLCLRRPEDGFYRNSRWTAHVVPAQNPGAHAARLGPVQADEAPAPRNVPSEYRRRAIRARSSSVRTLCHDAQHRNRREDYVDALNQARDLVARLERAIGIFDQD